MGLAISAAAFYILTSIFAREIVNTSKWKVVTLAFVLTFLLMEGNGFGQSIAASAIYLLLLIGVAATALRYWLRATWRQSLKIAGSYVGVNVAYSLAFVIIAHLAGANGA